MWELTDCTDVLLREIGEPEMKRFDVAQTYLLAMQSTQPTDWARINAAIVERWSLAGLLWIKTTAHRIGRDTPGARAMLERQLERAAAAA